MHNSNAASSANSRQFEAKALAWTQYLWLISIKK